MARTKGKARRGASRVASLEKKAEREAERVAEGGQQPPPAKNTNPNRSNGTTSGPHSVENLIEKAHILLGQSNFELAVKFLDRALETDPGNLEARELLGVAELEEGDPETGRSHLLQLFPPHTSEPPSSPSPYLYLAQTANDPQDALGYYSAAASILEKALNHAANGNGLSQNVEALDLNVEEARKMAVTTLVAMIEIWMSDLCFEDAAETNCDALISRALTISQTDIDVRLSLASIRMSQERTEEARQIVLGLHGEISSSNDLAVALPALAARLNLARQLLEHSEHLLTLSLLAVARNEDAMEIESAYLEGWAWYLRAEAVENDSSLVKIVGEDEESDPASLNAQECFEESLSSLLECAQLFEEQDYPDEGIAAHVKELLDALHEKGIQPRAVEEGDEDLDEANGDWEDANEARDDITMA